MYVESLLSYCSVTCMLLYVPMECLKKALLPLVCYEETQEFYILFSIGYRRFSYREAKATVISFSKARRKISACGSGEPQYKVTSH